MLKLNHKNLDVWKLSIILVKDIYKHTEAYPKQEVFGITNQLRRASVSISSNIAEGASRSSNLERKRFYVVARSSLVEIDTQLEISIHLNYVKVDELSGIEETINHVFAKLTNLINKTK